MCCILCCCCDSCNRFSSKCIELFIFIISLLSFGLTITVFSYINRKHITLICFIILIALILFSFLILICIGLISILRFKEKIITKRNKVAESLSIVGLVVTIFYLICIICLISMVYTNYEEINHPCYNIEKNENNIKNANESESESELNFENNKVDFCIENPNYNIHEIPIIEYIITFTFAALLCIFNFILIYLWFNDYRRIKFLVEGSLNDFDAQEIKNDGNKNNENENSLDKGVNERINKRNNNQLNNKYLYKIYSQQENGIRYDIYGRPIVKASRENDNIASTKDNLNSLNTQRYSKRKSILNNRVSVYIKRSSIKTGNNVIDIGHSNSSERNIMNKLQFSRNKTNNNIKKSKTSANAN